MIQDLSDFDLQAPPVSDHRAAAANDDVTRTLPHAVGPEKSILSTMLNNPQEFIGVAIEEQLTKAHFYLPGNASLFGFLVELFEQGKEVELISLTQHLIDHGLLDRVGGPAALADICTYAPSPGHFRYHLQLVKDKFILRRQIEVCTAGIANAYDAPAEVMQSLDTLEREVMKIREQSEQTSEDQSIKASAEKFLEDLQKAIEGTESLPGLTTGFEELDRKTNGGLKPGDMFVLAARPSMGKTSLMMNVVEHVVFDLHKPSLVFSVEMSQDQLIARLIASRAKFATSQIAKGYKPNKGDLQRIQRATMDVMEARELLHVDHRADITINQIRAKARRKKRENDIQFIAIDYLQLIRSKTRQAENSREREVAEISSGIKALAKELGIPIMILAQLNRGPEGRTGKNLGVPRMSDLRESGSIEQDADMVGLLYRSAYYADSEEEREAKDGEANLSLAKNRNGETGDIPLTFIAALMRFETGSPVKQPELPPQPRSRFDDED